MKLILVLGIIVVSLLSFNEIICKFTSGKAYIYELEQERDEKDLMIGWLRDRLFDERSEKIALTSLEAEIVDCESEGISRWGDLDLKYPVYGVAQFQPRTFKWMKELSNMPWLDFWSENDQRVLLRWALLNGKGRHWTCYRDIVLAKNG